MSFRIDKVKKHEQYRERVDNTQNTSNSNTGDSFKRANNMTLWDTVKETANAIGKIAENTWIGAKNGLENFSQAIDMAMYDTQKNRFNFGYNDKDFLKKNPDIAKKIQQTDPQKYKEIMNNEPTPVSKESSFPDKLEASTNPANIQQNKEEAIKKHQNKKNEYAEQIQKNLDNIENPILKKTAELASNVGNILPGFIPGIGAVYTAGSAKGAYYDDAMQRGMNEEQANTYSGIMSMFEGLTEQLTIGNIKKGGQTIKKLVGGTAKEVAKEGTEELGKTSIKSALKHYGISMAENALQEGIMEPLQEITASVTGGKDKANWENMGQRMLQSGIDGGLTAGIMDGANAGINSCIGIVQKIRNGQTPTLQETQIAVKEASESGKVDFENSIIESTQQQFNKYKQNMTQNTGPNQIVTNLQNNLPQNTSNTPAEQQVQQTAQQIGKVAQNGNMRQTNTNIQNQQQIDRTETINNLKIRTEKELTGSEKTDVLDFLNNTHNIDESSINSITEVINMARNNTLNTNETYKTGRHQKYVKYMNKTNEYDSSALQQAKEIIPGNKQGRRTKEQWLQVAEQIGNNIADKSASEIEEIAYRTWQEERPASKESLNRQGKKYVQFTFDDWINTIYNTVKKIDSQNVQTINQSQQVNQEQKNQQLQETDLVQPVQSGVQNYQYIKSDNTKIDNLRQDVSKYFDNSEQTQNFVNMLEKIIQDKDVEIRLDDTLVDNNGKVANGKYQDGVITINPNSTRAGEFIAIHELTHAIGTKDMINIVENYRKSNTEFDTKVQDLLKNYNQTEITEEALADVSAQLFGNQEFISNLSQENPSLFQKIYNEIKYLWHQFRGYKNQNQFIEDLQYKWEQAYRSNNELNNGTNYSIQTDNNGNRYVRVDTDQNIFEGIDEKDYNKIAKMYIQDYLLGETTLSDNDKAVIDKKGANKYTNPGKTQYKFTEKMKLTPELKNALEISEKVSQKPPVKANSKYSNWEYYNFRFSIGKNNFEGLINIGVDSNGNKHFYEINNIKKTSISETSLNNRTGLSYNNSILPTQENVNSDTQKYSMQENEKNTQNDENSNQSSFSFDEINSKIKTKGNINKLTSNGITMTYVHMNNQNTQSFGSQFGQNLEPKGEYMSIDTLQGEYKVPGAEYGTIHFDNPLILDHISTDSNGWKKTLSEMFGNKTGKSLSNAIEKSGYDAIITIDEDGNYNEIVNINGNKEYDLNKIKDTEQEFENNSGSFNLKEKQLEIIQNNNPMQDDYHTGIRNIEDIKTFDETLQDSDWSDYDEFNPDYTRKIAEDAIKTGKITVYSSYPIEQGIFVSPSYMEAESYSGDGKVYSKEVDLDDVAWIDPTQGQYAKVENAKYSKNNESWQEYLDNNFKSKGTRTDLQAIRLSTKENTERVNKTKETNIPAKQNTQQMNNQQTLNIPLSQKNKQRKHYKSIIESNYTSPEAKKIAKELIGIDTYVPESNKKQLARADQRISTSGAESELNSLLSRAITGGNIKADDIAVGERLIQYYSKIGDKVKLQDAVQATGMAGTSAGQTVQALSMLNHQTPEGQAIWIQRSVDKMNNDLARQKGGEIVKDEDGNIRVIRKNGKDITDKVELFNLTPDMIDKIVNSKNTQELQNNVNQVYDELGQQVTKSTMQKIDSWRYFSMLFNIRTHLRNVVGNTAMGATQKVKNKVAGVIEGVVSKINPDMERTHTIVSASKEVKAFAKNDINNVADRLGLNDNKYNPKTRLENSMRTFKSNAMENTVGKLFKFNDNALEAEDGFGLKRAYRNALAEYMTANKLNPNNITDSQLAKARNYAVEQAKEATFHQESKLASLLNQLQNKNKFAKATLDATLPFKKTPINVAKSGMEYSPAGLIKSIVYDSVQLRKGNITANQYIDNISKGLTGTGITLVGYALADMGILKASGEDDDKKEKYDEAMGSQTYAITIGDKTYSLDWLSPTGIPLFIGAELKQIVNTQAKTNNSSTDSDSIQNKIGEAGNNLINALSNAMSPMAEMSMLSGLTSTLQSYEQGSSQFLAELIGGGAQSYANQFIPTLSGQIAKTIDDKERSTTSTKTGIFSKKLDQTKNQMMNKIPGLRQMLPTKTDIWGNEIKQNENLVARTFENGVLPWARKDKVSSKVNEELNSIYEKTGESSIYPTTIEKKVTLNGENYRLTNDEFSKYQKDYGQTSYKLIDSLVNSKDYKNMTDIQKQKAIEEIYKYAKEKNKIDYAKKINKDIEKSTLYKTLEDLKANGGSQSDYLNYTAIIEGVKKDKEKNEILSNSNYSNITKSIIYKNTTGNEDDLYNKLLSKDSININEYLNYKQQNFESDKEDDGTLSGKSISGSKKKKVCDFVNNMNITPIQRVMLIGSQYKLDRRNQTQLYNYINNLDGSVEEKTEIFKKYNNNFIIYNNGTLSLK